MRFLAPTWGQRRDLWREMDDMLNTWARTEGSVPVQAEFNVATEVAETDTEYHLSIDLPGMKKEDIKVEVADGVLSVSGERRRESTTADKKYQREEKVYGSFRRSFSLPQTINTEKIEAKYEHGVLELVLPKAAQAQARKVEIH